MYVVGSVIFISKQYRTTDVLHLCWFLECLSLCLTMYLRDRLEPVLGKLCNKLSRGAREEKIYLIAF